MDARDGAGMIPLSYARPDSVDAALAAIASRGNDPQPVPSDASVRLIAGGTNLTDLMKLQLMRPSSLVDINRLPLDSITTLPEGGLRLGALARNADTAYHPEVETRYPLLSAAILAGASPQIRNMASNGGNLLQRTRCLYFYDHATPCNKRAPGSGCSAIGGLTKYNAILGTSAHCIATHPSDMCVALAALNAVVHVQGPQGERDIAFADFHRLPGDHPELDSTLAPDELIVHIDLPDAQRFVAHSAYLKIRERLSYAFALVSVAATLDLNDDGSIGEVRVALGGVAHKPWRNPDAEAHLVGLPATADTFAALADVLLQGAQAQGENAFKLPMARCAIVRALEVAREGTTDNRGRTSALEQAP
ncbi:xanthine dehydrogenase family protein subunit M [Xanthomonas sp. WHRI 10064A]|uniref:FAD binding domain-containing protein n=1 Tax=unclassified Xanthomonas TaxID=2643310 RepID=UPI002B230582|nr:MULTISPECIES: xanthine dehydrogenase family protein subunit M [unclassified Xanthomonas]MEA9587503.1 xanthine dehydrogenase family protein subunit M [Xanthomonas sp. WHRI 10064B]MEA9615224.1 xanthine dehydrogenase family protein subunit M [Xanthomonas sp. WHRI 10064A]